MEAVISLEPYQAQALLQFDLPKELIVVCKGYDQDDVNYTELVYPDDKYLDFKDPEYHDFELWIRPRPRILKPGAPRLRIFYNEKFVGYRTKEGGLSPDPYDPPTYE